LQSGSSDDAGSHGWSVVYRAGRVSVGEAQLTFLLAVFTQGGLFAGPSDFER